MTLSEWPLPEVRIACAKCGRESTLPRAALEAVFGGDADMFGVRSDITSSCVPTKNEVCQSRLADALLVQAIRENDETKVIDKDVLSDARDWRVRLGIDAS